MPITSINGEYITLDAAHVSVDGSVLTDGTVPQSKLAVSSEGIVGCAGVDIDTSTNTATIRGNLAELRGNAARFMTNEQFGTVELPSDGHYGVFVELHADYGEPFVSTWSEHVERPESLLVFGRFFDTYFSRFPLYVDGNLILDGVLDFDAFASSVCSFVRTVDPATEHVGYMDYELNIQTHSNYRYYVVPVNASAGAALVVTGASNRAARVDRCFSGEPFNASTYLGVAGITYPETFDPVELENYVMRLPTGTKYVVCSFLADRPRSIKVLDVPTNSDIEEVASSVVTDAISNKVNGINALTDSHTTVNQNMLFQSNGVERSWSDANTARLKVTAGEEIVVSGYTWLQQYGYWGYAFFSNGEIMSDTKYQGEGVSFNNVRITVPDGADEIRVNGKLSVMSADVMAYRTVTDFEECLSKAKVGEHSILYMGDSITQLGKGTRGWPGMFHDMVGGNNYVNTAVIGARWCDYEDTVLDGNPVTTNDSGNTISNQVEKISRGKDPSNPNYSRVPEYDNFDTIIIAAGTNDVNTTEGFDTQFFVDGVAVQTENLDRMTWCGAMRYAYDKLHGMYPDADIFICTPIQGFESTRAYDTINAKRDRIKRVCDRISDVVLVDTFNCGICGVYENQNSQGRDLIDGLHPKESGARKIARYNAREYLKFYSDDNK